MDVREGFPSVVHFWRTGRPVTYSNRDRKDQRRLTSSCTYAGVTLRTVKVPPAASGPLPTEPLVTLVPCSVARPRADLSDHAQTISHHPGLGTLLGFGPSSKCWT